MCKSKSKRKILPAKEKWTEAADRAEKHIEDLQAAVRVFRKNAKSAVPWPGDKKKQAA